MTCCGRHRQPATLASPTHTTRHAPLVTYAGATGLTILGPATGRIYRFSHSGARLRVDPRDAAALLRHPTLRMA